MRTLEVLQYCATACYIAACWTDQNKLIAVFGFTLATIFCSSFQGLRLIQILLILTVGLNVIVTLVLNTTIFLWLNISALALALLMWSAFGLNDYSKFRPSGPFKVGFRKFTSTGKNDCAVFYPTSQEGRPDQVSLCGPQTTRGLAGALVSIGMGQGSSVSALQYILRPMESITVPLHVDSSPALQKLQPIIFSHGLSGFNMFYSVLCRELASCGYLVVSLTHNDGSACFSPSVGNFMDTVFYDEIRTKQLHKRQQEICQLADEIMTKQMIAAFGPEWTQVEILDSLVIMGHSFGAITTLGSAAKCPRAKALIALDPWFFPRHEEAPFGTLAGQQTLILMTEHWPEQIKKHPSSPNFDNMKYLQQFIDQCETKPLFKVLLGMAHINQTDFAATDPIQAFLSDAPFTKFFPISYLDYYVMNAWLAMRFLEDQGLCAHPQHQQAIHLKLNSVQSQIKNKYP